MVRQTRTIAVPVFCGLCFFLYLLTIPTLRLPLSWGVEDFFIADILHTSLPLRVAPLQTGEFWRIITYALLHGSWWHTLLNLFGLWITGNTLERVIGWRQMTLILLIGAVAGAAGMIGSLLLDPRLPDTMTCIGASAILTACIGTITTCFAENRLTLWFLFFPIHLKAILLLPVMFILLSIECAFPSLGMATGAHIGGWLAGLLCGWILRY